MADQNKKLVYISGQGIAAFPNEMSDDKILSVIRKHKNTSEPRHPVTAVSHEDANTQIPPELMRIKDALGVKIVQGKPYGNAVASVADHEPHKIEINDPQRFAQGKAQTIGHEIVHLWFSQLPGGLQKQVPPDDPKNPYDISKASQWRKEGKKLWQLPQEAAATLIQRYIADPTSRESIKPWLEDFNTTPLSVEQSTSPGDKGIVSAIRPPLPPPPPSLPLEKALGLTLPAIKAKAEQVRKATTGKAGIVR